MRKVLLLAAALMAFTSVQAQRIGCIHNSTMTRADKYYLFPEPFDFDPQKTYRQPVVLISFSDQNFSMDNPKDYYNRLFNEKGFNEGYGLGCVADYFRDQSGGRLNLQFDIYGPFKVDITADGHGNRYYGSDALISAAKQLFETETTDFSIYDWDGDGKVNQLLFVVASYSGQQKAGYTYPNSGESIYTKLPGDIYAHFYSVACE